MSDEALVSCYLPSAEGSTVISHKMTDHGLSEVIIYIYIHTHIHTTIYMRTESSPNSSNAADIAYHHVVVVCKRGLISCFGNLRGNYS